MPPANWKTAFQNKLAYGEETRVGRRRRSWKNQAPYLEGRIKEGQRVTVLGQHGESGRLGVKFSFRVRPGEVATVRCTIDMRRKIICLCFCSNCSAM